VEDERSTTVCNSIIDTLKEKAVLLDQWNEVHENMFGQTYDIPPRELIHLSKLRDSAVTADTCDAAHLLSLLIAEKVEEAVQIKISEKGGDATNTSINAYQQGCHNHLRNVLWIGAGKKHLSTYCSSGKQLSGMNFRHHVSTMFDSVLQRSVSSLVEAESASRCFIGPSAMDSRVEARTEGAAAVFWMNRRCVMVGFLI
jgi:hypothetical protein